MLKQQIQELSVVWTEICMKTWKDKKFKEKLLKNPRATLKEYGFEVPDFYKDVKIEDHGDDKTLHIDLMSPPAVSQISEEELAKISGSGSCANCSGC